MVEEYNCTCTTAWLSGVFPVVFTCGSAIVLAFIIFQTLYTAVIARARGATRLSFANTDGESVLHVPVYGRVTWVDVLVGTPLWQRKGSFLKQFVLSMFVLVQRSASIHIDFPLVSLRIEPIRAPTKTVTVKRVQVCQMDSGPTSTSVLHLSELISKLS